MASTIGEKENINQKNSKFHTEAEQHKMRI
jgi:hypothetical protein